MARDTTRGNGRDTDAAHPMEVGRVLYGGQTMLDFVGPHLAFASAGMRVHLVSDSLDPVVSDTGPAVLPTVTLEDRPLDLDILFVPGGRVDEVLLDLQRRAERVTVTHRQARTSTIVSLGTIEPSARRSSTRRPTAMFR
ncbi:DJ-1/PfpI family protein [Streptomyces sp. NPDC059455]|uniref:DJ-1/PfpI family protein n=1 Tax=Streptomyces sp. NPDC059455 TaxID=3346837 RepID=UPI0036A28491